MARLVSQHHYAQLVCDYGYIRKTQEVYGERLAEPISGLSSPPHLQAIKMGGTVYITGHSTHLAYMVKRLTSVWGYPERFAMGSYLQTLLFLIKHKIKVAHTYLCSF